MYGDYRLYVWVSYWQSRIGLKGVGIAVGGDNTGWLELESKSSKIESGDKHQQVLVGLVCPTLYLLLRACTFLHRVFPSAPYKFTLLK